VKTVLLPVKGFSDAKQRLGSKYNAETRAGLACAMLSDVLCALSRARKPDRIIIFTAAAEVTQMARSFGFDVMAERSVEGHSAAVNHMVAELSLSASRILAIAADLPTLMSTEIDFVLEAATDPITLIPSRDWTGTNGIVILPPARIMMEYGPGSFRRHLSKAAAAGLPADVLSVPGMAFDIDSPEDLQLFLDDPRKDSETWRYSSSHLLGR
jgi:2-phospho-L-lactate guanylyltransferase